MLAAPAQQHLRVLDHLPSKPKNPALDLEGCGRWRVGKDDWQIVPDLECAQRCQHGFRRDPGVVPAGGDILACADDQEPLEPAAAEPVQLVLEAFPVGGETAVGQVVDGFAFNGELVLETADRITASKERVSDGLARKLHHESKKVAKLDLNYQG